MQNMLLTKDEAGRQINIIVLALSMRRHQFYDALQSVYTAETVTAKSDMLADLRRLGLIAGHDAAKGVNMWLK